jgi:drug/metabolite transporter (DMT)-like permease
MVQLHFAVFLFGAAGVLGKLSGLPSLELVALRTLLGGIALGIVSLCLMGKENRPAADDALSWQLAGTGALLALHWHTFFLSIEYSSVAVGLLSYSTFPVFAAFFEPLLHRKRPRRVDVIVSVVVLSGLSLVVPPFGPERALVLGAGLGVISAAIFAALALANRRLARSGGSIRIAFNQNAWACVYIFAALALGKTEYPPLSDAQLRIVLLLGFGCTALVHSLFVRGLRWVSVVTASVIAALEPVYGIVLAAIFLGEWPSLLVCTGGAIVLLAATYATLHQPS